MLAPPKRARLPNEVAATSLFDKPPLQRAFLVLPYLAIGARCGFAELSALFSTGCKIAIWQN
jgi:hypothetical protein